MKVVILSTYAHEGGAAIAAERLQAGLRKIGVDAAMLTAAGLNSSRLKRLRHFLRFVTERLVIFIACRFRRPNLFKVSIANTGTDLSRHPLVQQADIIHLHWINQGFLALSDIRKLLQLGKPLIWTMHDMWPFTGICHHAWKCERYKDSCGYCPFLESGKKKDLSYRTMQKKLQIKQENIRFVAVSKWLKAIAMQSQMGGGKIQEIAVIPNTLDTEMFRPMPKKMVRQKLSLSLKKKIILMGAAKLNDPIKGFKYLKEALYILKKKEEELLLILLGEIKKDDGFLSSVPIECKYVGKLSRSCEMAEWYAAADVTVVSSLYETFGQTLIEAMACGCPTVSFDNSGQTDIIDHKQTGYLAHYEDAEDLAEGILWVLNHNHDGRLSVACRHKVETSYADSVVAQEYLKLYSSQ
ncbi:MAG: glycosyltransferase [Tannerellaceae bacterium]|jgi:glycosyltransferase involved in cell wall biosynthesis|nr:glycosyltransferase [Tannerellaceae bacterium]